MPLQRASRRQKAKRKRQKEKGTHDRMADVIENNATYWVQFTFCLLPFTFPVRGVTSSVTA